MLDWLVTLALVVSIAMAIAVALGARKILSFRTGWIAVVFGLAVLPLAAAGTTFTQGVRESSKTEFCLRCHEMEDHGKTLFVDNPKALAAIHYQNRLISRDETCFACHTDYAMFGDIKAKLNGLRHVWVHYLGEVPEKMELYQPYPNHNCLHCHEDARRFVEQAAHATQFEAMRSGETSCLTCHQVAHDHKGVAAGNFWQAQ